MVRNTTATFEETPRPLSEFAAAYHDKKAQGIPWIVADLNGQVVGYGTYGIFRKASGYKSTVEHSLHVDANFRGQGIGSEILKELIVLARQNSVHAMVAGIDSANPQSILLHEKFGFKKVGEMPQIARKFSRWLDLTLMQLILKD